MTSDLEDLKARLLPHERVADQASVAYRAGQVRELFAALASQAAEIERLTKERDKARHDFEIAAGDADFLLKSKQEAETERDALKAENQKLRIVLDDLVDACDALHDASGSIAVDRHSLDLARAVLQSGGER